MHPILARLTGQDLRDQLDEIRDRVARIDGGQLGLITHAALLPGIEAQIDGLTQMFALAFQAQGDAQTRTHQLLAELVDRISNLEGTTMALRDDFDAAKAELGSAIVGIADRIDALDDDNITAADIADLKASAGTLRGLAVADPDIPTDPIEVPTDPTNPGGDSTDNA